MGVKLGFCGIGNFGPAWVVLFQHHPQVDDLVLCDADAEALRNASKRFGVQRTCSSLEELCNSDVDAVALFTPRHIHGQQALQILNAGKHVFSAVPPAVDLEVVHQLVDTVERNGLIHMSAETSLYYPATLYCKQRHEAGDFGRFVYAESQYLHDLSHYSVYMKYEETGDKRFKRESGLPPMYYPTHSISMPLAVTGARVTSVSCLGIEDRQGDGIFGPGLNPWDNSFSNEVALFRTSDGGVLRANEMRRIGWRCDGRSVYMSFFGTEGSYEQNALNDCWVAKDPSQNEDLCEKLRVAPNESVAGVLGEEPRQTAPGSFAGVSPVHPVDRLPETYRGLPNGHQGSHAFLADDFVRALTEGTNRPGEIHEAANWCAAGLLAHESAKQEGKQLEVPSFGR